MQEGARVIAPICGSPDKTLQDLSSAGAQLDVVKANVSDEADVIELATYVKNKYGVLDHVVTAVGGWWQGGASLCCLTCTSVRPGQPPTTGLQHQQHT